MEMADGKKLDTAIIYLQRIADGKNPVNNTSAEEDSVLNNPNVIRCMYFAKEVLEAVRRNDGYIGKKPGRKERENGLEEFPLELLDSFTYMEDKPISRFVEQLNGPLDVSVYKKLKYRPIVDWLKQNGYLTVEYRRESNQNVTRPTQKGLEAGIRTEQRVNTVGQTFTAVVYGRQAQEFLVENMGRILAGAESEAQE